MTLFQNSPDSLHVTEPFSECGTQDQPDKQRARLASIPAYLKNRKQWILWRYDQLDGAKKPTKVPYQPSGHRAKSNDSSTWSTFADCLEALATGKFYGIGFTFAQGDGVCGVDLDHCYCNDGQIEPWANAIVDKFSGAYIEKSPSGDGLHIWCFGRTIGKKRSKKWKRERDSAEQGVEWYDHNSPRYFTVTGDAINGQEIIDCQSGLDWLHQEHFAEPHEEPTQARRTDGQADVELVRKALECIRADDYGDWILVGMALKSVGLNMTIWEEWSCKSNKYTHGVCAEKWNTFNGTKIGLGTVFHLAKQNGFQFPKAEPKNQSSNSEEEVPLPRSWPKLPSVALHGIAGEIVRHVDERSEADPAAVLLTFLAMVAVCFGSDSFYMVGDTKHYARLYVALVGKSSKARKGTSSGPCRSILQRIGIEGGACQISDGPLSTGEGIIYAVRDPSDKLDENEKPIDPGVADKRLLVIEGEFGAPLKAAQRDGNTLSAIMRSLYDHGNAAPLTKNNRIRTSGAHVGLVCHITGEELGELLRSSDIWNGFTNRFLWGAVRRTKRIAFPQPMDESFVTAIAERLKVAIVHARQSRCVSMTDEAAKIWEKLYPSFEERTGILAAVTDRAEPHVLRLALIFALLDCATAIDTEHLWAAVAVWQFCDASAKYIFGDTAPNPKANQILLQLASGEKSRTYLNHAFGGHLSSAEMTKILHKLQAEEKVQQRREGGGKGKGQPVTYWSLAPGFTLPEDLSEIDEVSTA